MNLIDKYEGAVFHAKDLKEKMQLIILSYNDSVNTYEKHELTPQAGDTITIYSMQPQCIHDGITDNCSANPCVCGCVPFHFWLNHAVGRQRMLYAACYGTFMTMDGKRVVL